MLRSPVNDTLNRLWCGPAAISSITGAPVTKINKMVRRYRREVGRKSYRTDGKKMPVIGMHHYEVVEVMRRLGYLRIMIPSTKYKGMTLNQFLIDSGHMGPFIVNIASHYVTVWAGLVCDNWHGGVPLKVGDWTRFRKSKIKTVMWFKGKE